MYYAGLHPLTDPPVRGAKTLQEKKQQRVLLQYWRSEHQGIVRQALYLAPREDLIGYGAKCLVPLAASDARQKAAEAGKRSAPPPRKKRKAKG